MEIDDEAKTILKTTANKKTITSEDDLKNWCISNNLEFALEDLDIFVKKGSPHRYLFLYTGNTPNEYNKGYTNHWLFLNGNFLFDSYGLHKIYNFGSESVEFATNRPQRLQAYESNVCGQYCCLYYKYIIDKNTDIANDGNSKEFCGHYGFTYNHSENDETILEWYNSYNQ